MLNDSLSIMGKFVFGSFKQEMYRSILSKSTMCLMRFGLQTAENNTW